MTEDRFGRTADEEADDKRHCYAQVFLTTRRVADWVGQVLASGEIEAIDTEWLRGAFAQIAVATYFGTIAGMGSDDWPDDEIDRYHDTYSDGSPVLVALGDLTRPNEGLPGDFAGDLPWCPNWTSVPPGTERMGGTPPGAVIFLVEPPHRRNEEGQRPTLQGEDADGFTPEELVELFYGNASEELLRRALGGDTSDRDTGTDNSSDE
ncbi:MAG: hypothetical protein K2X52_13375 [Mycobacteriaceae bacterium]|nr:hypothetical protein [Mycobacteriaceae bacterium]